MKPLPLPDLRSANRTRIRELVKECRFYRDHCRATEILYQVHASEWIKARGDALIDLRYAFAARNEVGMEDERRAA